jgi:putative Holliday junction resolvase
VSRILAVDWGTQRVGVAISDPGGVLARSLPTLVVRGPRDALVQVAALARREGAAVILIGLPLHLSGEPGESARAARKLGAGLSAEGFRVLYRDERLSSEKARDLLRERGERRPEPGRVDAMTAALLLQEHLDGEPGGGVA